MDYYNSMPPQNQQPPMMQSMHYTQMAPPAIGQQQDLWDHDKHVSINILLITSIKKTKLSEAKYLQLGLFFFSRVGPSGQISLIFPISSIRQAIKDTNYKIVAKFIKN